MVVFYNYIQDMNFLLSDFSENLKSNNFYANQKNQIFTVFDSFLINFKWFLTRFSLFLMFFGKNETVILTLSS